MLERDVENRLIEKLGSMGYQRFIAKSEEEYLQNIFCKRFTV